MNVAGHWTFAEGAVVVVVSVDRPRRGMIDVSECVGGISRVPVGRAMRTAKVRNKREVQIDAVRKTSAKDRRMWRVCWRKKDHDVDASDEWPSWASREAMRKRAAPPRLNGLIHMSDWM